jgi:flagellar protein FlbT
MNITLRAGEKLYINGAVIRVDRKATIELLNDVTFLLENHVMQADQATTPLRQIYFAVQVMLMDPGATAPATSLSRRLIDAALAAFENPAIIAGLKAISEQIDRSRHFEALKALRALFPLEEREMSPNAAPSKSRAA